MENPAREPSAYPPIRLSALPKKGRLLAVDWGTKRIGLAISDPSQAVATPLGTLTRRAGRRFPMAQMKPHLDQHQPVGVVMGLPLDQDGREGPAAHAARAAGELIGAKTGLPVDYWDERMSTARVGASMREAGGRTGSAGSSPDALAATVLLQAFLDHRRS
jgi:putative Holliday junction resolvase